MRSFAAYVAEHVDGKKWCVAAHLTDRLRRQGYEIVIPQKRFSELEVDWERETYGAPLASLHDAAPDMLAALKMLFEPQPYGATQEWRDNVKRTREACLAAIAKAEGKIDA